MGDAMKSGWMRKESSWVKSWRLRYFRLKGSTLYFSENENKSPHGQIDLTKCMGIYRVTRHRMNVIEVVTTKSKFYFHADTDEANDEWTEALKVAGGITARVIPPVVASAPVYAPAPAPVYAPAPAPVYSSPDYAPAPAPVYIPAPAPAPTPAPQVIYTPAPTPAPQVIFTPAPAPVRVPAPIVVVEPHHNNHHNNHHPIIAVDLHRNNHHQPPPPHHQPAVIIQPPHHGHHGHHGHH